MSPVLRPGRDDDAADFIALIGGCWAEYPGCVMDVDGEVPELRALASHYAARGGALWAAEADGAVVGVACTAPAEDGAWIISKVYVARAHRGTGLAHRLLDQAEAHARAAGAQRLVLWSDTRFEAAHRFYEKRHFVRSGPIRVLDDLSHSLEFRYARPLRGVAVEALDAAAAASAVRPLVALLQICVAEGAAISFLPPVADEPARGFWRRMASEVATGSRVLLAAWLDGVLVGTVTVDLGTPPNQPHRAEIQKLMVHPHARRHGVGRALMQQAEQSALQAGRRLLTLDTKAGDPGERLYRALGWIHCGSIPGYALDADGTPHDTELYYRTLG